MLSARMSPVSAPTIRRIGWLLLTVNSPGLSLFSARYFSLNPAIFLTSQVPVYRAHLGPFMLHITRRRRGHA